MPTLLMVFRKAAAVRRAGQRAEKGRADMGMTKAERLERQKARLAEMKEREAELHAAGYRNIAGVDEVGRGPLAGPVVAAAVVLPDDFDALGVDDSKKLSEKKREELYDVIMEKAVAYGIGMADHDVIDEINILQATKQAMRQAISKLDAMLKSRSARSGGDAAGIAGGIDYVLFDAVEIEDIDIPQESVIKGDAKILCIAAASIVAKVTRDRMMVGYAQEFPGYGFEKNKGYGTRQHYDGIDSQGICPIHRKTFLKKYFE